MKLSEAMRKGMNTPDGTPRPKTEGDFFEQDRVTDSVAVCAFGAALIGADLVTDEDIEKYVTRGGDYAIYMEFKHRLDNRFPEIRNKFNYAYSDLYDYVCQTNDDGVESIADIADELEELGY
jgi:hypothetical protein